MTIRSWALAGLTAISLAGCGAVKQVSVPPATVQQAPASEAPAQAVASLSESAASVPASPSVAPSVAPAASVAPQPTPGPAVAPMPASIRLGPLQYIRQSLNNCGPAAIAEVLRFWGVNRTQDQVQAVVRPDLNSRGMWPYGVPAYVNSVGMSSLMGVGGTPSILKALVANGFPTIVAQWVSADDHTGHYREIEGYDDKRQVFISTDSYLGPNHEISYAEFDQLWARGNQRFMVVFPPDKQPLLNTVLKSAGWEKTTAYEADLVRMQQQPNRPFEQSANGLPPAAHFKAMSSLAKAWDHIQLGQLDLARTEIAQGQAEGANPVMLQMVKQTLAIASS